LHDITQGGKKIDFSIEYTMEQEQFAEEARDLLNPRNILKMSRE
jgi:hypothetical protein